MALNFADRFKAAQAASAAGSTKADDRPKAQIWLNVGLPTDYKAADGTDKYSFLSLAQGIPLDTMAPIEIKGRNKEYNDFAAAQNKLREMLLDHLKDLKPGESVELDLKIMARRVDDAPVANSDPNTNQFLAALKF
jgi:hypothetical protein